MFQITNTLLLKCLYLLGARACVFFNLYHYQKMFSRRFISKQTTKSTAKVQRDTNATHTANTIEKYRMLAIVC